MNHLQLPNLSQETHETDDTLPPGGGRFVYTWSSLEANTIGRNRNVLWNDNVKDDLRLFWESDGFAMCDAYLGYGEIFRVAISLLLRDDSTLGDILYIDSILSTAFDYTKVRQNAAQLRCTLGYREEKNSDQKEDVLMQEDIGSEERTPLHDQEIQNILKHGWVHAFVPPKENEEFGKYLRLSGSDIIEINAHRLEQIANEIERYYEANVPMAISGIVCAAFVVGIRYRSLIAHMDNFAHILAEAINWFNPQIPRDINLIRHAINAFQTERGIFGIGCFETQDLAENEVLKLNRLDPWNETMDTHDPATFVFKFADCAVTALSYTGSNGKLEKMIKQYRTVNSHHRQAKGPQREDEEIYLRFNRTALQSHYGTFS
eukprot:487390_1